MTADPYRYFRLEARELVEHLGAGILALDKGATDLAALLRHAHTLKGAARVVRQVEIAERAHRIEEALAPYRAEPGARVPKDVIAALLAALDEITARLASLDRPAPAAAPAGAAPAGAAPDPAAAEAVVAGDARRTVRAELAELDALLDGIVEAHGRLEGLRARLADLERARQLVELAAVQLVSPGSVAAGDPVGDTLGQLAELLRESASGLRADADQVARELGHVRGAAEHLRLVPARSLLPALERTARDIAVEQGKVVEVAWHGPSVRIDADILAAVGSALVQLVRNGIAHGIEPPAERRGAGKPEVGQITLEVRQLGQRVAFACRDDGRGIDLEALRRHAERRGIPASQARELGVTELLRAGISTSAVVTEAAGRGIGFDVVREVGERLGGSLTASTWPGQGTAIELVVPVSLAAVEALVFEGGGVQAAIPLVAVRRALRIDGDALVRSAAAETIVDGEAAIPFVRLASALGGRASRCRAAVIVEVEDGRAALGVERLLGVEPIVVRAIPSLAAPDPIVSGAALDPAGQPRLVLDPAVVLAAARAARGFDSEDAPAPGAILVIDDSLTTRMLEQSILESAGYQVTTATSGEQGLAAARERRYALFLVDVEMPGMDGFTFIERVRADPELRETPAILVTSRASAEDRERGRLVGANGYIVKSEFDQAELLARIERLIGAPGRREGALPS